MRIQEENSGECLEIAEEGGGLALRAVHYGVGQLFTPGTASRWTCSGVGKHQIGEGRSEGNWCPKEEDCSVGPPGGPFPGGQARFNGMGRGGEEVWGQGAEKAGNAWAVEHLP